MEGVGRAADELDELASAFAADLTSSKSQRGARVSKLKTAIEVRLEAPRTPTQSPKRHKSPKAIGGYVSNEFRKA